MRISRYERRLPMKPPVLMFVLFVVTASIFAQCCPTDGNAFERGHNKDWSHGVKDTPENTGRTRESTPEDDRIERAEHFRNIRDLYDCPDRSANQDAHENKLASAEEVACFNKQYGHQMNPAEKPKIHEVYEKTLEKDAVLLLGNKDAVVNSISRAKDHPIEAAKKNGPGPHTRLNTPIDIALPRIGGGIVHDWRDPYYDREKMQRIIDTARIIDPNLRSKDVLCNDRKLHGVTPCAGHDNHAHIGWSLGPLSEAARIALETGDLSALQAELIAIQNKRFEAMQLEREANGYTRNTVADHRDN